MNIVDWLSKAESLMNSHDVSTARLDCLVLLEDFTGKDRAWLLAHPDYELTSTAELDKKLKRRALHEPLAYIRGKTEFYGREFMVNEHTLEPRPETETMIDLVKTIMKTRENLVVGDIGTGCGCIAISVKLELPQAQVLAVDIDEKCVKTARENSIKLGADISFYQGNLLKPVQQKIDIALCNLPYVPAKYELNEAAKFEPKHAILGGEDGLDLYRELFSQLSDGKKNHYSLKFYHPEYVLTESLPFQHKELANIAQKVGYQLDTTDDFIQVFRAIHNKQ